PFHRRARDDNPQPAVSRDSRSARCLGRVNPLQGILSMTDHTLSRRAALRGMGVTMALPWLESLPVWGDEPRGTRSASDAPVRLAVLFSGNGFHSREWWAKGEGKKMELGRVLTPLADFREKML